MNEYFDLMIYEYMKKNDNLKCKNKKNNLLYLYKHNDYFNYEINNQEQKKISSVIEIDIA